MPDIDVSELLGEMNAFDEPVSKSDTKKVELIAISLIDDNEKNFYDVSNVEGLAADIAAEGVWSPLHVMPVDTPDGRRYRLISGHRRKAALLLNGAKNAPCFIIVPEDEKHEEERLIQLNRTAREISDWEHLEEIKRIEVILEERKAQGEEFKGKRREHVSEKTGLSQTKITNLKFVGKNLAPVWVEPWRKGLVDFDPIQVIAHMPADWQEDLYRDQFVLAGSITAGEVKDYRDKRSEPPLRLLKPAESPPTEVPKVDPPASNPTERAEVICTDEELGRFLLECVVQAEKDSVYDLLVENNKAASSLVNDFKSAIRFRGYHGGSCSIGGVDGIFVVDVAGVHFRASHRKPLLLSWAKVISQVRDMVWNGVIQHSTATSTPEAQAVAALDKSINQAPPMDAEAQGAREAFRKTRAGVIPQRIQASRLEKDWSEDDLGDELYCVSNGLVDVEDVRDWENATDEYDLPSMGEIVLLSEVLECSTDYLLGRSDVLGPAQQLWHHRADRPAEGALVLMLSRPRTGDNFHAAIFKFEEFWFPEAPSVEMPDGYQYWQPLTLPTADFMAHPPREALEEGADMNFDTEDDDAE